VSFGGHGDAAPTDRDTGMLERFSELGGQAAEKMIEFSQEKVRKFQK